MVRGGLRGRDILKGLEDRLLSYRVLFLEFGI